MAKRIHIENAREGNLRDLTVDIPRDKLVVLTGVSGSGKSTLAVDLLYQECQRQYLEAMGWQGIGRPRVGAVRGLSPAVLISQRRAANRNPRSTVGTATNLYTELRMVYEKLGVRRCPHCGELVSSADCREETEKRDGEFKVYMYCRRCGARMDKLTRTEFSHNTREGACPRCEGLGSVMTVNRAAAVREERSLEDGAVPIWEGRYREYQTGVVYAAFAHYGVPIAPNTPVAAFSPIQKAILYDGVECETIKTTSVEKKPPKNVQDGRFEGVIPLLWRRLGEKQGDLKGLEPYFSKAVCPDCGGERLNAESSAVTVMGKRLPELSALSLEELYAWLGELEETLAGGARDMTAPYLLDLRTKLGRFLAVGLGYLSLDRQAMTLSGGESQRIRLSAALDGGMTGLIYILDEPTVGLHPRDTAGMIDILKELCGQENTVLVIEHDPDVMAAADHIIDLGPGAGRHGGTVAAAGTLEELRGNPASVTGAWLAKGQTVRERVRRGNGRFVEIRGATLHNLKNVSVRFPEGCVSAVTGVSGSGKSTLIFDVLAKGCGCAEVAGLEDFDQVVAIDQAAVTRMKRSNVATYSGLYGEIRRRFGESVQAGAAGLTARDFSFNTPGGRCEACQGMGAVKSNLLFFEDVEVPCPICGGRRFREEVLAVRCGGRNINEVLALSVEEALEAFGDGGKLGRILGLLRDVGLGYLELGQSLTTLSGGEGQRLKLAAELLTGKGRRTLYLMDEPTVGLHGLDVEHFLALLDRMADAGNTVILVEHNTQVIRWADYVADLGPEGGVKGGEVLFQGTPLALKGGGASYTGNYL